MDWNIHACISLSGSILGQAVAVIFGADSANVDLIALSCMILASLWYTLMMEKCHEE